jgi:hypothetical protein
LAPDTSLARAGFRLTYDTAALGPAIRSGFERHPAQIRAGYGKRPR